MQASVTVFDVQEKRKVWKEAIQPDMVEHLVFLDENWEKAFTTYQGGTTGDRFVQYLRETLLPALKPGDIIVMDNMCSHHVKAVREILEEQGINVLYLPPCSPDLNSTEKMWPKMKALLRGWKIRNLEDLPDAVRMALTSVSSLDCRHWFAASAYCQFF